MDFDVLIIGSGAGGGMAALGLCEQGFKVGLVERGPRFDPKKDYIFNYADWESRKDPLNHARFAEQTIDRTYLTETEFQGKKVTRHPLNYHRVHGVGGSTLNYQGEAHRFGEHAFNCLSEFGWGLDWPINYADLESYYAQVEILLGVAGEQGNPHKPDRGAFPTPRHPLSQKSQWLADSGKKVGLTVLPNTLALPSKSIDGRKPCQHSGNCNYGCVFGAKSSVDQAIIPRAEKTGNLQLFTETRVLKLDLSQQGEVVGLYCREKQRHFKLTAKRYVLAAGAIETPRLLMASANEAIPNGYGNQYDQLGRYFMETIVATVVPETTLNFTTYQGPPLDSRVWDFYRPKDNKTNGFVLGSAGYLTPWAGPKNHAIQTPGIGRAHKKAVRDSFGKFLYLFGISEQEPIATNRLTLSDQLDDYGVNRVKVHCEYSTQDRHTIKTMDSTLRDWVDATPNMRYRYSTSSLLKSSATHVAGSCRMGVDSATSVVDAFGKIHGSKNCYITDGSVMPTQGAGDSPSLTIQALALRTADRIIEDLKS